MFGQIHGRFSPIYCIIIIIIIIVIIIIIIIIIIYLLVFKKGRIIFKMLFVHIFQGE